MKAESQETAWLKLENLEPGMGSGDSGTFIPGYSYTGTPPGMEQGSIPILVAYDKTGCLWLLYQRSSAPDLQIGIAQTGDGLCPFALFPSSGKGP